MTVGYLILDDSNRHDSFTLSNLTKQLSWFNCKSRSFDFKNLAVSILMDNRLPDQEFIYIDEERGILIIVDGYIYNKNELFPLLHSKVQVPLSIPELLLNLFLIQGPDFVKNLNGDFAILIYQKDNHRISFFRDHVGIRPLAILATESVVFFSTDPLGLCKAFNQNIKADYKYLINRFLVEGHDYSLLPNNKVINIPPAHYLEITSQKYTLKRYWHPEKIKKDRNLSSDQVISELRDIVTDAVKIRSDNRFKASAHVSGGIDSGVVAALARKEYSNQTDFYGFSWSPTYTIQNEIVDFDERIMVNEICNLNNIIPLYVDFTEDDLLLQMKSWRYPSEIVFENKVVDMAKTNDVNLIFSGWGGDEFISIGHRGIDADLIKDFSWRSYLKKYPILRPNKILSSLIFNVLFPEMRRPFSKYKTYPTIYPYLKKSLTSNVIAKSQRFVYNSRRKVHLQLLSLGHLYERTKDWYIHGQQNGIEYRYPLLDKRIIEYMLKVPSRCLVGGHNYRILLRIIGENILPDFVLKNKSKEDPVKSHYYMSFSANTQKMLMNEFKEFCSNPELSFVDFDLLQEDIKKFKLSKDKLL